MWGYVSDDARADKVDVHGCALRELLLETQRRAMANRMDYLTASTALSELMLWISEC